MGHWMITLWMRSSSAQTVIFSGSRNGGNSDLYRFARKDSSLSAICTSAKIKLHPISKDEKGFLVPMETFQDALVFVRELSVRRVGFGLGVLGADYLASFISPESGLAGRVKNLMVLLSVHLSWLSFWATPRIGQLWKT